MTPYRTWYFASTFLTVNPNRALYLYEHRCAYPRQMVYSHSGRGWVRRVVETVAEVMPRGKLCLGVSPL